MIYKYLKTFVKINLVLFFTSILYGNPKSDKNIKFEKILSIKIQVEMDDQYGEFMNLKSGYYPYTKGTFDGVISGKLLPQGGAFSLYSDDYIEGKKLIEDDIRMILITDEGEKIYCEAEGLILKDIKSKEHEFMHTSWRFRTSSTKHKWLNHTVGFANTIWLDKSSEYLAQHDIYIIKQKN